MQSTQILFTDTHCHLYSNELAVDIDDVISRAFQSGIKKIMMPNIDMHTLAPMNSLSQKYPDSCFPMIGLHPTSVKPGYQDLLVQLKSELDTGTYIGIGETGVDLYWDASTKEIQIDSFEQHILWALEKDLPIIIHSRESLDLTISLIGQHQNGQLRGIFHCFGGTIEQAMKIQELGFKIGIGGIVTFKKAGLDHLLPLLPPSLIVLETDSPYLAPTPNRGKRNEPAHLLLIAQKTADSLSMSLQQLAELTNSNAEAVFGKKG